MSHVSWSWEQASYWQSVCQMLPCHHSVGCGQPVEQCMHGRVISSVSPSPLPLPNLLVKQVDKFLLLLTQLFLWFKQVIPDGRLSDVTHLMTDRHVLGPPEKRYNYLQHADSTMSRHHMRREAGNCAITASYIGQHADKCLKLAMLQNS